MMLALPVKGAVALPTHSCPYTTMLAALRDRLAPLRNDSRPLTVSRPSGGGDTSKMTDMVESMVTSSPAAGTTSVDQVVAEDHSV